LECEEGATVARAREYGLHSLSESAGKPDAFHTLRALDADSVIRWKSQAGIQMK
jgi:hypothetical protein